MTTTMAPRHLASGEAAPTAPEHSGMARLLDVIERVGNKVPHPVMMFLYLIIGVIVLSTILALLDVQVTDTVAVADDTPTIVSYYEDSTEPIVEALPPYGEDWHL